MEILQFGTGEASYLAPTQITDFDSLPRRQFQYIFHNTPNIDSNGPNDAHAWVGIHVPWPDTNFTLGYGWQMVARYNNNPSGIWWRQTLNQVDPDWYRLADEQSGVWTPTMGGTLTNGSNHNYLTQLGRWFRQGTNIRVNFRVRGTFSSTPNRPTGSPVIRGLASGFTAKNEAGHWWSNIALQSDLGAEGISGIPLFVIKANENFIRFQLQDLGLNGNAEYEGTNSNLWNYASMFDFAGDLSYEIA